MRKKMAALKLKIKKLIFDRKFMNYTSIKQSTNLLKLGLTDANADFCYISQGRGLYYARPVMIRENTFYKDAIPCWSTEALMEALKDRHDCCTLVLCTNNASKWTTKTSYYELANWKEKEIIADNLFDAVYDMLVWLLENGY